MKALLCLLMCSSLLSQQSDQERFSLSLSLEDMRQARLLLDSMASTDSTFSYLAALENIEELRTLWKKEQPKLSQETVEAICWAIIRNASQSYHPKLRAESLLATSLHSDARNIPLLVRLLHDSHPTIQELALQLSEHYLDEPIQEAIFELAQSASTEIRVAAASLLSKQRARSAAPLIEEMLHDDTFSQKDRIRLINSLARLQRELNLSWLENATKDPQPEIRALACCKVQREPSKRAIETVLPLLEDESSLVLECALETLGLWQHLIPEQSEKLHIWYSKVLNSSSIKLQSLAAWALFLSNGEGGEWFTEMILNKPAPQSHIACAHFIKTGTKGLSLAEAFLNKAQDPIIKINLAAYLLSHRNGIQIAAKTLHNALQTTFFLLEETGESFFSWISKTTIPHTPLMPRLPESHDLLVRLQLLALQCYSGEPISKESVETMLKDRAWGIPLAAAGFIFQELAPSLEEVLFPLLESTEETIRIQAALLLVLFSQSEQAATILWDQFEKASKEGKETLVLGFSTLSFEKTKDHLTPLLFDASPSIRTRAAGALLASLYS